MHLLIWLTAPLFAPLLVAAFAQDDIDSVKVDPAHHEVLFENEQVRVVRWTIAPGDKTLNHSHPDSLNINLTDYNGQVTTPKGVTDVHDKAGSLGWRPALIHIVENIGTKPMMGIIVEPKKPASVRPAGSADPVLADPDHQKAEFENEQIRVIREHYMAGEEVVLHGHPDNVQVLLSNMKVALTANGKANLATGKAGEVRWRTAGQHSGRNLDIPLEQIVIEMKGRARRQPMK